MEIQLVQYEMECHYPRAVPSFQVESRNLEGCQGDLATGLRALEICEYGTDLVYIVSR
jgi:hypothetical protein